MDAICWITGLCMISDSMSILLGSRLFLTLKNQGDFLPAFPYSLLLRSGLFRHGFFPFCLLLPRSVFPVLEGQLQEGAETAERRGKNEERAGRKEAGGKTPSLFLAGEPPPFTSFSSGTGCPDRSASGKRDRRWKARAVRKSRHSHRDTAR